MAKRGLYANINARKRKVYLDQNLKVLFQLKRMQT